MSSGMILALVGLFVHTKVNALPKLPVDCNGERNCCPNNCNGPSRGQCISIEQMPQINARQCKSLFPLLSASCDCHANFAGLACETCANGWNGEDCTHKQATKVRRNLMDLTKEEVDTVIDYFYKARNLFAEGENVSEYDKITMFHYEASLPRPSGIGPWNHTSGWGHAGSGFPTWHRATLLRVENLLARAGNDPAFAMPYWDWTDELTRDLAWQWFGGNGTVQPTANDTIVLNVSGGFLEENQPFADWVPTGGDGKPYGERGIRRCLRCDPTAQQFASASAVDYALDGDIYDRFPYNSSVDCGSEPDSANCEITLNRTFRNFFEGFSRGPVGIRSEPYSADSPREVHNRGHIAVGGTMIPTKYSPNDPLFWLHHTFVDSLFERWLDRKPREFVPEHGAPYGHNKNDCMGNFFPFVTPQSVFRPSSELGYVYNHPSLL